MIRKAAPRKWCIHAKHGGKRLGCYPSLKAAKKRLGQIEYFKRHKR